MRKPQNKLFWICLGVVYAATILILLISLRGLFPIWNFSPLSGITLHSWIFPIVFLALSFLISLSLYWSWRDSSKSGKKVIIWTFGLNFILNLAWHVIFFTLRKANYSFYPLIALGVSIIPMFIVSFKIRKSAGLVLVPYFLWIILLGFFNYIAGFQ